MARIANILRNGMPACHSDIRKGLNGSGEKKYGKKGCQNFIVAIAR